MFRKHDINKSLALFNRAKEVIPGGTQLFGKRPQRHAPGVFPIYAEKGLGSHVWDVDKNEYIDFVLGYGPVILGYAYKAINNAVRKQMSKGNIFGLNNQLEIELAEELITTIPCAEMVRFARTGGEADAMAIRIARTYARKDIVLFCGYHGWHDWYICANLKSMNSLDDHLLPGIEPLGVPKVLAGTSIPFEYNNIESLKNTLEQFEEQVACIIMEPCRSSFPDSGYLKDVRKIATKHNVVLIFDEIVTGFRMAMGGAQEYFDVTPDIAVFGKAMANGFPLNAVVGKKEFMAPSEKSFISSTFWGETTGLAAGLSCIKELKDKKALEHIRNMGDRLRNGLNKVAKEVDIPFECREYPAVPALTFKHEDKIIEKQMMVLYLQEMAKRGVLPLSHMYISYSHSKADIDYTISMSRESFQVIKEALGSLRFDRFLEVTEEHVKGFRRLV